MHVDLQATHRKVGVVDALLLRKDPSETLDQGLVPEEAQAAQLVPNQAPRPKRRLPIRETSGAQPGDPALPNVLRDHRAELGGEHAA